MMTSAHDSDMRYYYKMWNALEPYYYDTIEECNKAVLELHDLLNFSDDESRTECDHDSDDVIKKSMEMAIHALDQTITKEFGEPNTVITAKRKETARKSKHKVHKKNKKHKKHKKKGIRQPLSTVDKNIANPSSGVIHTTSIGWTISFTIRYATKRMKKGENNITKKLGTKKYDFYYIAPDGKKLRSLKACQRWCTEQQYTDVKKIIQHLKEETTAIRAKHR
jgi:ribosomal protein L21